MALPRAIGPVLMQKKRRHPRMPPQVRADDEGWITLGARAVPVELEICDPVAEINGCRDRYVFRRAAAAARDATAPSPTIVLAVGDQLSAAHDDHQAERGEVPCSEGTPLPAAWTVN
jgi:hypothetical protein